MARNLPVLDILHDSFCSGSTMRGSGMKNASKFFLGLLIAGWVAALVWVIPCLVPDFRLGDFTVTFYRSANNLLRGENVYVNDYPHPLNGRQYPPFNPIWILYADVPVSVFPIRVAEPLRFLFDIGAIFLFAYLSARWARLKKRWYIVLLLIAPWYSILLYAGQWAAVSLLGALLCYWGARNASPSQMAIGLWLALVKPNIMSLVLFAAVVLALRNHIFIRTMTILIVLVAVFSIPQPGWLFDLGNLYIDRVVNPRLDDSLLLLPGYPYSQFGLLIVSIVISLAYFIKSKESQPTLWLWAAFICTSLVGAPHAFIYDWFMLMIPLAWLLRTHLGPILVIALYAYVYLWPLLFSMQVVLPSSAIVPSATLFFVLVARVLQRLRTIEMVELENAT